MELLNDVTNKGKRVVVTDGPFIQGSVVHDGVELATLLFAVEEGGSIW